MFVSPSIVFTELHKTGGSHIGKLLKEFVGGEQIGKHNPIPAHYYDRYVLGSIRNPWDWYVSLWAYGCLHKGSVFMRTTRRLDFSYYYKELNKSMGVKWLSPQQYILQFYNDSLMKPSDSWESCYSDYRDPEKFRSWLKMLLCPARKLDIGEGYGFSWLSPSYGLYTYRFLRLFSRFDADLYSNDAAQSDSELANFWYKNSILNGVIRTEHLEGDFLKCINEAGVHITAEDEAKVFEMRNKKTNTSARNDTMFYYDRACKDLVADKERFLIGLFGYEYQR